MCLKVQSFYQIYENFHSETFKAFKKVSQANFRVVEWLKAMKSELRTQRDSTENSTHFQTLTPTLAKLFKSSFTFFLQKNIAERRRINKTLVENIRIYLVHK